MFEYSARSLIQFCRSTVDIPVVDGRPVIINSPGEMQRVLTEVGDKILGEGNGGGLHTQLYQMAVQGCKQKYENFKPDIPEENFIEREVGAMYIALGINTLYHSPHDKMKELVKFMHLPVCALQFKGVGCGKYDGHYTTLSHDEIDTDPHLRFINERNDWNFVVDERFEGKAGVLIHQAHQPGSMDPLGGVPTLEGIGKYRESQILQNGGELSGITVGVVPLIHRQQFPELCQGDMGIVVVAILDDTRRMDEFSNPDRDTHDQTDGYQSFAVEKYFRPPDGDLSKRYVGEHFEQAREAHLDELMPKLGRTAKAVLASGLTNPQNQNLVGNISIVGGILDMRNLTDLKDPNQAIGYTAHLIQGLSDLGRAAGFGPGEIFQTRQFQTLLTEFLGGDAKPIMHYLSPKGTFRTGSDYDEFHHELKLVGLMTDAWVRQAGGTPTGGYHDSDRELVGRLNVEPELREEVGIDAETLKTFNIRLSTSQVPIIRGKKKITLEQGLEPYRAKLEKRMLTVPTIEQHMRQMELDTWGFDAHGNTGDTQ